MDVCVDLCVVHLILPDFFSYVLIRVRRGRFLGERKPGGKLSSCFHIALDAQLSPPRPRRGPYGAACAVQFLYFVTEAKR